MAGMGEGGLEGAFRREQGRGLHLSALARVGALGAILVWLFLIDRAYLDAGTYLTVLLLAGTGAAAGWVARWRHFRPWMLYALATIDHLLVGSGIFTHIQVGQEVLPAPVLLRTEWFAVFFLFIAASALAYLPGLVLWNGAMASAVWLAGALWILDQPGTIAMEPLLLGVTTASRFLEIYLDPMVVNRLAVASQILLLLLVSATLALAVRRARILAISQVALERERLNLSRYFAPDVADRLAAKQSPLAQPQQRTIAVLFADLAGFTRLCENADPQTVIDLLSGFRERMERAVFRHGGIVDKYIGDCVMAGFGVLDSRGDEAGSALACARAMLGEIDDWNRERTDAGLPPLALGIGVHLGPVVVGDIGSARRVEFTLVGDTVNVASRLMSLSRTLGAALVVSDTVADAAAAMAGPDVLAEFRRADSVTLRGRDGAVVVWYLSLAAGDGPAVRSETPADGQERAGAVLP